jgi:cysteinyl-tRNA synthetase
VAIILVAIILHNTLTRKKEEFSPPKDKQAGIYTCGPTVYNYAHIGNLRAYIFSDILQRALKYNGYELTWIMNITDVDDKTIRDSKAKYPELKPKEALLKFTQEYEKIFWKDLEKLNIEKPDEIPHATEFIPQMQNLIIKIIEAGYGYEKDKSFYFNVAKYSKDFKYGNLVDLDLSSLKTTDRIQADEYEKEEIQDFVLWKAAKNGEPSWDFEYLGKNYPGRPGWHIECSAMSHEYLKVPFDIHTGGIDLKFPHHENEIAQSVAGYGAEKLANFFLHNEHVLVNNEKMSKSLKNFYTLNDLEEKKLNPLAYRYLCLNSNYRSKLNFTWQSLEAAQNALSNLYNEYRDLLVRSSTPNTSGVELLKDYRQEFLTAINDDLNTPQALAVIWEIIKDKNLPDTEKKILLLDFDKILGLGLANIEPIEIPANIKKLSEKREEARKNKNWEKADKARKEIESLGYLVEDTETGPKISKNY